jgi:peptide deformylase
MVKEILQLGNPKLWEVSIPVVDVKESRIKSTIEDLAATLYDFQDSYGFGRAIAAPQIGVQQRIIFMHVQPMGPRLPLINPEIIRRSSEMMELWDDCFSFPDLMVRVRRHAEVGVRYTDESGERQTIDARGDLSELLQHEIDHLDGILATDRAIDQRAFAMRSEIKRIEMIVTG